MDFELSEWLNEDQTLQTVGEVITPALSVNEVRILNFVEQVYWETGLVPTPEAITEELSCSSSSIRKAFGNETFRAQLATRGIDPEGLITVGTIVKQTKALSPKQILVANMMLNLHDKRSQREKLQLVGVSSQQFHAWMRQPAFVEFMRKRGEALFSASDYVAYKSLVQNVTAGDNKSLELFFRMRGIYNPTLNININIESVLVQVVEVITRHVKDPAIINAIANELDTIIEAEEVA